MAANTTAKSVATPRKRAARKVAAKPVTAGITLDRKMNRKAQRNITELARTGNTEAARTYWNNALRTAGVLGKDVPNLRSI